MSIILASRGLFNQAAYEMLHALPLAAGPVVAMSICRNRQSVLLDEATSQSSTETAIGGLGLKDVHSVKSLTSSLQSEGIRSEGIVKTGCLVDEVSNTVVARNADVIILVEAADKSRKLKLLATDGISVLRKTGKPVLLQPNGCTVRGTGSVLVAMSGTHHSPMSRWHMAKILDLADKETVVLSVSSPFYPVFGKVAVGMRSYQSEALREIWTEQASEASTSASLITNQLKEAGAKSWFIIRTGRFVNEIHKAAQSVNASLVCVFVDPAIRRRWFGKSELTDLMEAVNVPVMLVPCERL